MGSNSRLLPHGKAGGVFRYMSALSGSQCESALVGRVASPRPLIVPALPLFLTVPVTSVTPFFLSLAPARFLRCATVMGAIVRS